MMELWDILDENGNKTGRVVERGNPMARDEFHLVVHVWIMNRNGEFLIARRTPNKTFPGLWGTTGGSAVSGDDSLTTALKETREELGVTLDPANGIRLERIKRSERRFPDFLDVWLFRQDVDLRDVVLNPDETCDAMWASRDVINDMTEKGEYIGREYLDRLFSCMRWVGAVASLQEKM